ncbi:MAG TPA: hypothetical protein VFD71_18760, partial [Planctomycetota bacterium]|nr:hypothetical protein [Planctomycetota bacterium]
MAPSLLAQLPGSKLFTVSPAGGKAGTTFDVTIGGEDLDEARALYFSQPGVTAVRKMQPPGPFQRVPQPVSNVFTVTIAADCPVGVCDVRTVGRFGASNPRAFHVGALAEIGEVEPNNSTSQAQAVALETTVNGAVSGGADVDCFKIAGKAGQRFFVDCQAQRIDSRLDAVLVLSDASGVEIERCRDAVRRDPLIDYTPPADGELIVKLYDSIYGGSPEHYYRLSVTAAPRVDFILPPCAVPGGKAQITLYGRSLPGGQPVEDQSVASRPLVKLPVEIDVPAIPADSSDGAGLHDSQGSGLDAFLHRLPAQLGIPEPLTLYYAAGPVTLEVEPNNSPAQAQKLMPPCEAAGQFFPKNDEDWFVFDVQQGDVFMIEAVSQRLGVLTDPFLLVQLVKKNEKGEEQVQELQGVDDGGGNVGGANFDTGSDDPVYRLQAPSAGVCRIFLRDQYSTTSADPRNVYRLSIRKESPDFRLIAVPRTPGANPDPN